MAAAIRMRTTVATMLVVEFLGLAWYVGDDVARGLGLLGPPVEDVQSQLTPLIVAPALLGMVALAVAAAWMITADRTLRFAGLVALWVVFVLHLLVIAYLLVVAAIGFDWNYMPWTIGISVAAALGAYLAWIGARISIE